MQDNVLICGLNWLGDNIMCMPAVQLFKEIHPSCRLTILTKPSQVPLWEMCEIIDEVVNLDDGIGGIWSAAKELKTKSLDKAFVFPNSFRSVLVPFLARIPVRQGFSGDHRVLMMSHIVTQPSEHGNRHQAWEYMNILGVANEAKDGLVVPYLNISESVRMRMAEYLKKGNNWIGLVPGAARGPSKRWPAEHFVRTGRNLVEKGYRICVFGSYEETDFCSRMAEKIGKSALSMAGRCTLQESVASLALCRAVVTNDSGGMHLAAAAGTKIAAVFGITDPAKTGPLGTGHRIITCDGATHSRDVKRKSGEAREALESIEPDRVVSAVMELCGEGK